MQIWSAEIKDLERLYDSIKGQCPDLDKELEQLIRTEDVNVVLLYSRRCLEIIVSDLCECELKRSRKTEPLKGIIDKLLREEKVPSYIITSMDHLNSLSTFGTHPKDFDPEQVKPVLINLAIVIRWYQKYRDTRNIGKMKVVEEEAQQRETSGLEKKEEKIFVQGKPGITPKLLTAGIVTGILLMVSAFLVYPKIFKRDTLKKLRSSEERITIAVMPFKNLSNDTTQLYFCDGFIEEILNNLQKVNSFTVRSRTSSDLYRDTRKSIIVIGNEIKTFSSVASTARRITSMKRIRISSIFICEAEISEKRT
jgi:TolB-like protein